MVTTSAFFVVSQKPQPPKAEADLDHMNAVFVPEKIGNPYGLQITFFKNGSTRSLFVYSENSKVSQNYVINRWFVVGTILGDSGGVVNSCIHSSKPASLNRPIDIKQDLETVCMFQWPWPNLRTQDFFVVLFFAVILSTECESVVWGSCCPSNPDGSYHFELVKLPCVLGCSP